MPVPLAADTVVRKRPNIHICGNPGTGKTTLARKIAQKHQELTYVDLGKEGRSRGCIDGRDEELDCDVLDYEKLAVAMVPDMKKGGKIVDWIHADFWEPSTLIDLVVVLTCDNTILFDRYKARGYNKKKIEQNIDSEIMQEIVSETREYYEETDEDGEESLTTVLTVLKGDTEEDMNKNMNRISTWIERYQAPGT